MRLTEAISMLERTPATLETMLTGLGRDWLDRDDGPGTWSAYDIVGHLMEAEAHNWLPRIRTIVDFGVARTFAPFDREAMLGRPREPVEDLLTRFRTARRDSLAALDSLGLSAADLDRCGTHPEFGQVRLGQVLAAWVAHDLTHSAQIGEVLARHYRDEVGPYRAYLPALDRVAAAE